MNPNIMTLQERISKEYGFCFLFVVANGYQLQTNHDSKIWEHVYSFNIKHDDLDAAAQIPKDFYNPPKPEPKVEDVKKETTKPKPKSKPRPRKRSSTKRG